MNSFNRSVLCTLFLIASLFNVASASCLSAASSEDPSLPSNTDRRLSLSSEVSLQPVGDLQPVRPVTAYSGQSKRVMSSAELGVSRSEPLGEALRSSKVPVPKEVRDMAMSSKYRKLARARVTVERSAQLGTDAARSEFENEVSSAARSTSGADMLTATRNSGACGGYKHRSGLALTPMRLFLSPPGVPHCVPLSVGPPGTCTCRYFCGRFLFVRYCGFQCGSVSVLNFGFHGFACKVTGVQVPLPGTSRCPLHKENLCSA